MHGPPNPSNANVHRCSKFTLRTVSLANTNTNADKNTNTNADTNTDSNTNKNTETFTSLQQIHTSDSQHDNCKDIRLGESHLNCFCATLNPPQLVLVLALNPPQLRNKPCFLCATNSLLCTPKYFILPAWQIPQKIRQSFVKIFPEKEKPLWLLLVALLLVP